MKKRYHDKSIILRKRPNKRLVPPVLVRAAATVLITLILTSLIASPFALAAFGKFTDDEWSKASDVGQACGAISAAISGIAVIGVAYSLQMQFRQYRFQQVQCVQANQLELMKIFLENPQFFGAPAAASHLPEPARQREIYINLVFKHLEMSYETARIPEEALSAHLARQFSQKYVRDWWYTAMEIYRLEATAGPGRRFFQLAMAEFNAWRQREELERWNQQDPNLLAAERGWEALDSHHRDSGPRPRRKPFVAPVVTIAVATIPLVMSRCPETGCATSLRPFRGH